MHRAIRLFQAPGQECEEIVKTGAKSRGSWGRDKAVEPLSPSFPVTAPFPRSRASYFRLACFVPTTV